jgi:hypothetical protein
MRHKLSLSSMSIGRCFVHASAEDDEAPNVVGSVVRAASAWKIGSMADDTVNATNAAGNENVFSADLLVAEISHEGFKRLVEIYLASENEE